MKRFHFLYKEEYGKIYYIDLELLGWCESIKEFHPLVVTTIGNSEYFWYGGVKFNGITTYLTKEDFALLGEYNDRVEQFHQSNMDEGSKEYLMVMEVYNKILPVIDKIKSHDNHMLHGQVVKKEKEQAGKIYNLTEDEVEEIFENYYPEEMSEWRIIDKIYNNVTEFLEDNREDYLDMTERDIIEGVNYRQCYWILENGKVVLYN